MSKTSKIIFASVAICSIFVSSAHAYNCYVASASDANFPTNQQVQFGLNCTACVRGKYVYTNGGSGSIWIWGCMTGSTGMIAPGGFSGTPTWGAAPPAWGAWGSAGPWGTWAGVAPSWAGAPPAWAGAVPAWAGAVAPWAGWTSWAAAGNPWSNWGAQFAPPAQPIFTAYNNMCVDGSFEGYSNSLGAYAYMCVCCGDNCNRDLRCKTFNGASTLVGASSTLATLLALTFSLVNVLHA